MSSHLPFIAGAIVKCLVQSLVPYARNARTHSDEQVEQLCASIREFGFTNPVLIDGRDGGIIAGHGRVLAAQKLGLTEVPCIDLQHLSEAQRRAYILADNKLALNADWDLDLLGDELRELSILNVDLASAGFGADELAELMAMPEEEGDANPGRRGLSDNLAYQIVIECAGEADQAGLLERLQAEGVKCRPLIL